MKITFNGSISAEYKGVKGITKLFELLAYSNLRPTETKITNEFITFGWPNLSEDKQYEILTNYNHGDAYSFEMVKELPLDYKLVKSKSENIFRKYIGYFGENGYSEDVKNITFETYLEYVNTVYYTPYSIEGFTIPYHIVSKPIVYECYNRIKPETKYMLSTLDTRNVLGWIDWPISEIFDKVLIECWIEIFNKFSEIKIEYITYTRYMNATNFAMVFFGNVYDVSGYIRTFITEKIFKDFVKFKKTNITYQNIDLLSKSLSMSTLME